MTYNINRLYRLHTFANKEMPDICVDIITIIEHCSSLFIFQLYNINLTMKYACFFCKKNESNGGIFQGGHCPITIIWKDSYLNRTQWSTNWRSKAMHTIDHTCIHTHTHQKHMWLYFVIGLRNRYVWIRGLKSICLKLHRRSARCFILDTSGYAPRVL